MYHVALCIKGMELKEKLKKIISDYALRNYFDIAVHQFSNPSDLYDEMQDEKAKRFDLLFMEIDFSNDSMGGIQLGSWIRNVLKDEWIQIIYLSEKQIYSLKIFDARPLNYQLLPVNQKAIESDLQHAMELHRQSANVFCYKSGSAIKIVNVKDIMYFESSGHKIKIIMKNEKRDIFYDKMCNIAQNMRNYTFVWIHNSYLVNYQYTYEVSKKQIKLIDGTIIPISRAYMKNLADLHLYINNIGI